MTVQYRLIPVLQIHRGELYKTVQFKPRHYIGDPVNSVRVFNLKAVDELIIVDIEATQTKIINYNLARRIGAQSFIPMAWGGGISTIEQVDRLFDLGIDKIVLGCSAVTQPDLLNRIAQKFGSQALIVSIDVKISKGNQQYTAYFNGGQSRLTSMDALSFAQQMVHRGVGELFLQDIDRDGTKIGLNHQLIKAFSENLPVPLIAAGGAKDWDDMRMAIDKSGASAAASGTQFSFYGPYHAVLQNYPTQI